MSTVAYEQDAAAAPGRHPAFEACGTRQFPLALEPVVLGGSNTVWLVEEGGVDLFHVAVIDGAPAGVRRHVCRIGPGALVIDRPGTPESALVAVPLSGTTWLRLEHGGEALRQQPGAADMLDALEEGWRTCLQRALGSLPPDALAPGANHVALLAFLEQRTVDAVAAERAAIRARVENETLTMRHALVRCRPGAVAVRRSPACRQRQPSIRRLCHRADRGGHGLAEPGRHDRRGRHRRMAGQILPSKPPGPAPGRSRRKRDGGGRTWAPCWHSVSTMANRSRWCRMHWATC